MMNPSPQEQIQLENVRGGILRFSCIDLGKLELELKASPDAESDDTEDFLTSINSQDYF